MDIWILPWACELVGLRISVFIIYMGSYKLYISYGIRVRVRVSIDGVRDGWISGITD